MAAPQVVGILGGMGPAAGADFARLFVRACAEHLARRGQPVSDQAFPEHWLAQVPVPDRSQALGRPETGAHQPLEPMLQAVAKLAALGARSIAVACNTAHAWHASLQQRFPQVELLHMAREVAQALAQQGRREVGVLATQGTYRIGLYDQALAQAGVRCHVPLPAEQEQLMQGIYAGVKRGDLAVARAHFEPVARALAERHGLDTLVLACTEIPLALQAVPGHADLALVDPAEVLARALARTAYGG